MNDVISINGAKVHNLKNIDVKIPHGKFIVITGLSGSGKSSLAFDTIYAEGQRRYMESFSAYARSFLGNMERPDVDKIEGLSPVISIEQKTTSKNPRSTVGTTTEIYDYLKLLYARIGKTLSPKSGNEVKKDTTEDVVNYLNTFPKGTKAAVLSEISISEPEKFALSFPFLQSLDRGFKELLPWVTKNFINPTYILNRFQL